MLGRRRRNPLLARVTICALAAVIMAAAAPLPAAASSGDVLVLEGKGWGHGVGMSQEGALSMALAGSDAAQILSHFYPGTSPASRQGNVRVPVHLDPAMSTVIGFPGGGEVVVAGGRQVGSFPLRVPPGARVRLWYDGSYRATVLGSAGGAVSTDQPLATVPVTYVAPDSDHDTTTTTSASEETTTTSVEDTTTTTTEAPAQNPEPQDTPPDTAPPAEATDANTTTTSRPEPPPPAADPPAPPPAIPPPSSPDDGLRSTEPLVAVPTGGATVAVEGRSRRYRGTVEAHAVPGGLRLVNQVGVEDYLRGMGEVRDPTWPRAPLQVQAVAARTYALRAMEKVGEVCDDERCQVYLGAAAEYPQMDAAVAASAGHVLVFDGALASTVYSANAGGTTASTREGFGTPDGRFPYLRVASYPSRDPFPWKLRADLADVARRLRYPGTISGVRVAASGPSRRVLELQVDGDGGPRTYSGLEVASRLGLRSTLFEARVDGSGGPVDTLPGADVAVAAGQSLPDEVPVGFSRVVAQAPPSDLIRGSAEDPGSAPSLLRYGTLVAVAALVLFRRRLLEHLVER